MAAHYPKNPTWSEQFQLAEQLHQELVDELGRNKTERLLGAITGRRVSVTLERAWERKFEEARELSDLVIEMTSLAGRINRLIGDVPGDAGETPFLSDPTYQDQQRTVELAQELVEYLVHLASLEGAKTLDADGAPRRPTMREIKKANRYQKKHLSLAGFSPEDLRRGIAARKVYDTLNCGWKHVALLEWLHKRRAAGIAEDNVPPISLEESTTKLRQLASEQMKQLASK